MDNCCYYRPFDDQTQDRVLIETDAVLAVLSRCEAGEWELIGGEVLEFEMGNVKDVVKFQKASAIYKAVKSRISFSLEIQQRANQLQKFGLKAYDSLEVASAESGNADVFLTTDDNLIKVAKESDVKLKIANPVDWIMEVMKNEQ
jgi:predicted nucleic acid-binding protein